jgi:hypothetical protein
METSVRGLTLHQVTMVAVSLINEAVYNPRKISPDKLAGLKQSIRRYGFLDPLVLRKANHVLVGGHQRLRAVREVCAEDKLPLPQKMPCIIVDLSEREAKKLNIALNKLGGDFDNKKLSDLLLAIQGEQAITPEERDLMGFKPVEFTDLMSINDPPTVSSDPKPFAKGPTVSLMFSTAEIRDAVRERLKKRSETENKAPGDIVYELLGGTTLH